MKIVSNVTYGVKTSLFLRNFPHTKCALDLNLLVIIADDEEERNLRRVSYLRATKEDRMHIDSDAEEDHVNPVPSTPKHRLASIYE